MTDGTKKEQTSPFSELAQTTSVRVYLLIENRLLREALIRTFPKCPDLNIVGQSGRTEATHQSIQETRCHVLVLDTVDLSLLPQCFESESQERLGCRMLLIGMSDDSEQFLAAVRRGISGYLLQDASASDVVAAVRAVFREEAYCPPSTVFEIVSVRFPNGTGDASQKLDRKVGPYVAATKAGYPSRQRSNEQGNRLSFESL